MYGGSNALRQLFKVYLLETTDVFHNTERLSRQSDNQA
jgi:hypothetical protein